LADEIELMLKQDSVTLGM